MSFDMHFLSSFFVTIALGFASFFGIHSFSTTPNAPVTTSTQLAASTSILNTSLSEPSPTQTSSPQINSSSSATVFSSVTNSSTKTSTTSEILPTGSSWLTTLPLGDNRYITTGPKKGYVYVCHLQSGGQGAQVNGSWIHRDTWTPSEKIHVEGTVEWPQATYSMKISGANRLISSNDLPTDQTTGIFPIQASDPAAAYDRNQGTITAHPYSFSFPADPTALTNPGCIYGEVGIMNNGVLLFDGFDALYRDALAHELQDSHDGHPNDEGYHKHGFISDIKNVAVSKVVGFAFDGYPITGPLLPNGNYLTTNDLDVCHGMTSSITLDGKVQESYHYVLTQDFPYSVSCFHAKSLVTPDTLRAQGLETNSAENVQTQTQVNAMKGDGTPPAPPQEAITACSGKTMGASCTVGGQVSGSCANIGTYFACLPSGK